ncbi:hypothetical protein AQSSE02_15020 [Streptococcus equi subsp. equi]|nr:hypothetical protein AQSSE11_15070 [Streptococcus equi subsp. equi]GMX72372.1 hypothetical protein AQSSE02_15020 [Streptococcus equi subsp. equi]GMX79595.1 hypothetical protein AQSSE13_19180 [Streptococcus equi subsp. equi]GMX82788.1 hypothetical protein AQSSE14_16120 [Streptococcus equi subsp. equi]GMX93299.1 hypothetical protein AQSSE07_16520 [Streptococcus equi subsp. equi]
MDHLGHKVPKGQLAKPVHKAHQALLVNVGKQAHRVHLGHKGRQERTVK